MEPQMRFRPVVAGLLGKLIRIPSVNPSLGGEVGPGEAAIAAYARDWLASRGVPAWLEGATQGRPNVVAELGAGNSPTLVFCGHLDTVGTAGMEIPPLEPRVEGGRVYGRGSYDMKGGVAAVMAAAATLAKSEPAGRLLLALVADEEYASIGTADFLQRHRADACILAEPSENQLVLGHKGFVWLELVTTGHAAHGSRWDLGRSAIGSMGRVIAALEEFDRQELRRRTHPLVGPASLHCALVQGGVGISTYAPECRLKVERRTIPGETAAQVRQELIEVVRRIGEEAEVRSLFDRPPLLADRESRVASAVREGATTVTGDPPVETGVAYWMDAALFAAAGIPAVNYGPTGAGAHGNVEWVDLDSVATCAAVLVASARAFWRAS